jgi:sugar O-acyltransferase (sialic acid O-acetyltransferase NeuD family)
MNFLIVGGGGFAKEVVQYAEDCISSGFLHGQIRGVFSPTTPEADILTKTEWLGSEDDYTFRSEDRLLIALGDGRKRLALAAKLEQAGANFATLIHPTAYVAPTASVGLGCIIAPFGFVGPSAILANHTVLNTYASIGHDGQTAQGVTLSPYACINGNAWLGEAAFLGSHASVSPWVKMGRISKLTAGSVLSADCPDGSLMIGNPAKGRVMFR